MSEPGALHQLVPNWYLKHHFSYSCSSLVNTTGAVQLSDRQTLQIMVLSLIKLNLFFFPANAKNFQFKLLMIKISALTSWMERSRL